MPVVELSNFSFIFFNRDDSKRPRVGMNLGRGIGDTGAFADKWILSTLGISADIRSWFNTEDTLGVHYSQQIIKVIFATQIRPL